MYIYDLKLNLAPDLDHRDKQNQPIQTFAMAIMHASSRIQHGKLMECPSDTHFDIPDSWTSIGEGAFYGCSGLTG